MVIPGLEGILQQQINKQIIPEFLTKLSNKSHFTLDKTGLERLLMNHFSEQVLNDSDLPIASLRTTNTTTLCADPCYLHADLDRVLLFNDDLALTDEESTALIAEIQPLLTEFGGELSQYQADKWLLNLETMPDLSFSALPDVNGRSVDKFLPVGADRRDWIRLWNEIQMQLHNAEINQQRLAEGKLAINSLWFWGAGVFKAKQKAWQSVQGNHSLLQQLSQESATNLVDNDFDISVLSSGSHLWLMNKIDIESDWQRQLQQLDEQILKPVWKKLRKAKLNHVCLQIPQYGQYYLTPFDSWKFW